MPRRLLDHLPDVIPDGSVMPSSPPGACCLPAIPVPLSVDLGAVLQATLMVLNHNIHCHTSHFEYLPGVELPPIPGHAAQLDLGVDCATTSTSAEH